MEQRDNDISRDKRVPSIKARELSIGYQLRHQHNKILHTNLNLDLYPGEVTCLLGLNGAGKSTLLRTLCGFQPSLGGKIEILGNPLTGYSQRDFSLSIGVVLTEKTNAGGITVYELVSLGRHPYTGFFGQLRTTDHNIIQQSLEAAGISHKAHNYVSELSDGERQKAMIAKALAQQCPIIILDEPTAFLDVTSRIETMVLLRKLATEQGKSILLSTHDLDLAIQMGDCLWLQKRDAMMCCGTPEDLILGGILEKFFNRQEITFDSTTGKLNAKIPNNPIGIEGDFLTSFWVGNALIRHGYKPSPISDKYIRITCNSPKSINVIIPEGKKYIAKNVEELLWLLSK
ncbi:MAG: ABC transporter ATP-binding protein [Bacteroidales bacterium]